MEGHRWRVFAANGEGGAQLEPVIGQIPDLQESESN